MAGWVLQEDIDKGAAVKILGLKPVVKHVEDGEQSIGWRHRTSACFRLQPINSPQLFAPLQECGNEFLLGGEMTVERCLGDTGQLHNSIDTDAARPLAPEQFIGRSKDSLTCALPFFWPCCRGLFTRCVGHFFTGH